MIDYGVSRFIIIRSRCGRFALNAIYSVVICILISDVSEAQALEGVVAVYTGADIARLANPYQATSRMKNYQATFIPPLALDKVRYVGEAVVAIVANSR